MEMVGGVRAVVVVVVVASSVGSGVLEVWRSFEEVGRLPRFARSRARGS